MYNLENISESMILQDIPKKSLGDEKREKWGDICSMKRGLWGGGDGKN